MTLGVVLAELNSTFYTTIISTHGGEAPRRGLRHDHLRLPRQRGGRGRGDPVPDRQDGRRDRDHAGGRRGRRAGSSCGARRPGGCRRPGDHECSRRHRRDRQPGGDRLCGGSARRRRPRRHRPAGRARHDLHHARAQARVPRGGEASHRAPAATHLHFSRPGEHPGWLPGAAAAARTRAATHRGRVRELRVHGRRNGRDQRAHRRCGGPGHRRFRQPRPGADHPPAAHAGSAAGRADRRAGRRTHPRAHRQPSPARAAHHRPAVGAGGRRPGHLRLPEARP